jgi:hypothetical protein
MSYSWTHLAPRRGAIFVAAALASASLAIAGGLLADGSARAASTLPTVTVAISPSTITVGGALQSGGVNVVSTATGVKEAGVLLIALKPGVTPQEVYAYLASKAAGDPNTANKFGSIVFDAETPTGKATEAQTNLAPGQYVALAFEGEGAPKTHTSFTVTAAKAPAALPTPEATIRAVEFGFRGPATLHNGELVRFENEGFLVHMDIAFPAKSRKAAKRLVSLLKSGNEKQAGKLISGPPVSFQGPVSSGAFQQQTISAKPGWYVEACFMDTQDKRQHTLLGMERIIKVTK